MNTPKAAPVAVEAVVSRILALAINFAGEAIPWLTNEREVPEEKAVYDKALNELESALRAELARPLGVEVIKEKIAPVQGYAPGIPWSLHLEAYDAYCKRYSPQPALIDLEGRNCRGGFGTTELDQFIPGWRDRVSEIGQLKAEVSRLIEALAASRTPVAEQGRDELAKSIEYRLWVIKEWAGLHLGTGHNITSAANSVHAEVAYGATPAQSVPAGGGEVFHIGSQNDALYIVSGRAPAPSNDYPDHEAPRTAVARVLDEDLARQLVARANTAPAEAQGNAERIALCDAVFEASNQPCFGAWLVGLAGRALTQCTDDERAAWRKAVAIRSKDSK